MGTGWALVFMPYGATWRRFCKAFHEYFHLNIISKYQPIQAEAAKMFLHRLLASSDNFMGHIQQYAALPYTLISHNKQQKSYFTGSIMEICYRITVLEHNDPYISVASKAIEGVSEAGVPGAFLVDLLPILKYVPSWFPGAGFKRKAARWKALILETLARPYHRVKRELVST